MGRIAMDEHDFQMISWIVGMFVELMRKHDNHQDEGLVVKMVENNPVWAAGLAQIASHFVPEDKAISVKGEINTVNLDDFMNPLCEWFNALVKFASASTGMPVATDEDMEHIGQGSKMFWISGNDDLGKD